jgi:hypothetical protein
MSADATHPSPKDRERAAELGRQARELHDAQKYYEARDYYRQSLALVEDEEVRASYRRLMATIGPM